MSSPVAMAMVDFDDCTILCADGTMHYFPAMLFTKPHKSLQWAADQMDCGPHTVGPVPE